MIPDIKIGIITCPRDNGYEYLHGTVERALKYQPDLEPSQVKVFADALEPPTGLPDGVEVEASDQRRLDKIKAFGLMGTLNMVRSMRWAATGSKLAFSLEDDIKFSRNWVARAVAAFRKVYEHAPGDHVLALSHWLDLSDFRDPIPVDGGYRGDAAIEWAHRRAPSGNIENPLWGAQSYLMLSSVAKRLSDRLYAATHYPDHLRKVWMVDTGVLMWCLEGNARLWSMHPCITQHIGDVSKLWTEEHTTLGGQCGSMDHPTVGWRMSKYFDDPEKDQKVRP